MPSTFTRMSPSANNFIVVTPNEIPIYFLPSVLGDGVESNNLIRSLLQLNMRNIHVYEDDRLLESNSNPKLFLQDPSYYLFNDIAKEVAELIIKNQPYAIPVRIIGNSFGGALAVIVGQLLQAKGYESQIFAIDSPAPTLSQTFLDQNDEKVHEELIKIVHYSARLSGIPEVKFTQNQLENLCGFDLGDCLNLLAQLSIISERSIEPTAQEAFCKYIGIAIANLCSLKNYKHNNLPKLGEMSLLITEETTKKYNKLTNNLDLDWTEYADKINLVNESPLNKISHTELLSARNSPILAQVIQKEFNRTINYDTIFQNQIRMLMDGFKQDTDVLRLLGRTLNNMLPQPSRYQNTMKIDGDKKIFNVEDGKQPHKIPRSYDPGFDHLPQVLESNPFSSSSNLQSPPGSNNTSPSTSPIGSPPHSPTKMAGIFTSKTTTRFHAKLFHEHAKINLGGEFERSLPIPANGINCDTNEESKNMRGNEISMENPPKNDR